MRISRATPLRRILATGAAGALAAALLASTNAPAAGAQAAPPSATAAVTDEVASQIAAIDADKTARTRAERKIDSNLLYAAAELDDGTAVEGAPALKSSAQVGADGRTEVDIAATDDGSLPTRIEALGGEVRARVPGFDSIRAVVPVGALAELAADDAVRAIAPAEEPLTNQATAAEVGPVAASVGVGANEADVTHGADLVRSTYGVDGTGVKACVLSDGIDNLAGRQATGDLPAVDILSGQAGSGSEGTAMLELIHDIAPGATLGFATAFGGQASFAQNIVDLRTSGCDVIVDDVTYLTEGAFQDDDIARAISQVKADGAIYFTSAGNSGNFADGTSGSWQGDFQDAGASAAPLPTGLQIHGWGTNSPSNTLTAGVRRVVTLQWADPLAGSTNDYDLYVLDSSGTSVVAASTGAQTGTQDPFEATTADAGERIVVARAASAADRYLALYTNRGQLAIATAGATYGHNASVDAISTAATPAAAPISSGPTGPYPLQHSSSDLSETFSSDGPSRSFFAPDGAPLTPGVFTSAGGVERNGIDLTAADGVTTTTPGFIPFFGTSAAAPNAAAVATLALAADPTLTPDELEGAMAASAIDIEAPGVDRTTGPGIASAPALMAQLGAGSFSSVAFDDRTVVEVLGDGDTDFEPGEVFDITQPLRNPTALPATDVTLALTSTSADVAIWPSTVSYGTIAPGAVADAQAIRVQISRGCACGTTLPFTQTATFGGGRTPTRSRDFTLSVSGVGAPVTTPYAGPPVPIPDNDPSGASATVTVGDIGPIADLTFTVGGSACSTAAGSATVGLAHTYVGDLSLELVSPSGTTVKLMDAASGNGGHNLCQTVFSDDATTSIGSVTAADAPFTGTYRPVSPLRALAGEDPAGTWTLRAVDHFGLDTGTILDFSIDLQPIACDELANTAPSATDDDLTTPYETELAVGAPGVLGNDTDAELDPLTATLVDDVAHGTLALALDGSLTYTPDAGFSGDDSFTYTAGDGDLSSAPATVTIEVGAGPVLSGSLTTAGGVPLAGAAVLAYAPSDGFVPTGSAATDADGTYAFASLAAGSYTLAIYPDPASGLPLHWFGGTMRATATTVDVVEGGPSVTVDEEVTPAASIAGVVLAPDGQPAAGVTVHAYLVGASLYFPSATATTAADGSYTLGSLAAASYEVDVVPTAASGALTQWYPGGRARSGAQPVRVTAGSTNTLPDIQLVAGGSISGDAGGPGVTVRAYAPTDAWLGSSTAVSSADGTYTLAGLPADTYRVAFTSPGGAPTWFGGATRATALDVVVAVGADVTAIDRAT